MLIIVCNLILPPLGYPLLLRVRAAIWGFIPEFHTVYLKFYIVFGIAIIIRSSLLAITTYRRSTHEIIRRQLRLVSMGIILSSICFLLISILLPFGIKLTNIPVLNSTFSIIAAIFLFYRHHKVSISFARPAHRGQ